MATCFPSTLNVPVPPLPTPGPSDLKSNTMVCLPGDSASGPSQRKRCDEKKVVEEHRLAFEQVQPIAAEAPALRDDHAFRAAGRNLDVGGDGVVRAIEDVGRTAGRKADDLAVEGEDIAPRRRAGLGREHALDDGVVYRKHLELLGLALEDALHLLKLVRHLRGQIVRLRVVLREIVEFPLCSLRLAASWPAPWTTAALAGSCWRTTRRGRCPGWRTSRSTGSCAGWRVGVRLVPGVGHADAFDGRLLDAVNRLRRSDAGGFQKRRHDVDHVMELGADAAGILDPGRPGHGHALARARRSARPPAWST